MEVEDHCIWFSNFDMNIFFIWKLLKVQFEHFCPIDKCNVMSLASNDIVDYCIWFSNFPSSLLDNHNVRAHLGSCHLEVLSPWYMAVPLFSCNGTNNWLQMMLYVAPDCIWGYLNIQKIFKGEGDTPSPYTPPLGQRSGPSWPSKTKNLTYTSVHNN